MTKQQLSWKTKWNTATDFEADQLNTSIQKKIHIHQGVGNKHQSSVTVRTRLSGTGFLLSLSTTTADCWVEPAAHWLHWKVGCTETGKSNTAKLQLAC